MKIIDGNTIIKHTATYIELNLFVKDISKTVEFYRILGFYLPEGSETKSYVKVENSTIHLAFYSYQAVQEYFEGKIILNGAKTPFELAIKMNTAEEVDLLYNKIVLSGYKSFKPPSDAPWKQRVAFVKDPDGNLIEITANREINNK